METSHLRLSAPKSPTLCTLYSCESLCYFPSTTGGNLSDASWVRQQNVTTSLLLPFSFSRTIFSFPLVPQAIWSRVLDHLSSVRHRANLKFIHTVVSYSHNIYASIAPVYHRQGPKMAQSSLETDLILIDTAYLRCVSSFRPPRVRACCGRGGIETIGGDHWPHCTSVRKQRDKCQRYLALSFLFSLGLHFIQWFTHS